MSDNLEAALRRAVGLEPEQETEPPKPGQPVALNDFDSLKSIIMHEMKNGAAVNAARKTQEDVLDALGDAMSQLGEGTANQQTDTQFINAVNSINNR